MPKAIIPYTPPIIDLAPSNADFQTRKYLKNRNSVLNELCCISGIHEIASTLRQDTVYKIVATPEGGKLYKDTAGNIKGVFYKDGKIVEHAKFQALNPSFVKAATTIGSQILLISIAMQLNHIEKGISQIIDEFQGDRISEINSGVNQYNQAMEMQNPERQSNLILHAIQTLNTGNEKIVRSLKRQIEEAHDIQIGFFDNWFTDKSNIAKEKFKNAQESFQAYLIGTKTLCECFAAINEPKAAAIALSTSFSNLKSSGIEMAARKARLVPFNEKQYPEIPWLSFLESEPLLINEINKCNQFADDYFDCIEIEIKPIELLEKASAEM